MEEVQILGAQLGGSCVTNAGKIFSSLQILANSAEGISQWLGIQPPV